MHTALATTIILMASSAALPIAARAEMKISHTEQSITITKNGTLVTEYRTDSKVPYLYPISTPTSPNLSRNWPMKDNVAGEEKDHPHHRSFWMSHGSVNGHDFWAWTGKTNARIVHLRSTDHKTEGDTASFIVTLQWQVDGDILLDETRHIQVSDMGAKTRIIDTKSTLTASTKDVTFGDTKEGFFALRVDRTLKHRGPGSKGGILNQQGQKGIACWGKRSPWLAFHGPDESGQEVTIAMMDHSDNLRHPTWWHAREYGLLAANPFGIHDFEKKPDRTLGNHTVKKGESLTFHYRVMLTQGKPDEKQIESIWTDFTKK